MAGHVVSKTLTQEQQTEIMLEEEETASSSSTSVAGCGGMRFEKHLGFWVSTQYMPAVKLLQMEFEPRPDDIYLASPLKSGTTWIKALVHTILALQLPEGDAPTIDIPRATVGEKHPHDLVLTIDHLPLYHCNQSDLSIFSGLPSPRLLHSHLPFDLLPPLVKSCPADCKIVYVARNPRDVFVSFWKFYSKLQENGYPPLIGDLISKETAFDKFCSGLFHGGPFAESVLSYWRESRRNPNKVMFLTYEELHADCTACVKRLGAFLGCFPTVLEEHAQRIVDNCSFDRLSNLEVNTKGRVEKFNVLISGSTYFREGKVGEWKKHFTQEMEDRIHRDIEQKLIDEGLLFTYS